MNTPAALARVGLPAFLKGAVFSRKSMGWKACVAETAQDAEALAKKLLAMRTSTRGQVLVVMEAMKTVFRLPAPADATVAEISARVGDMAQDGQILVRFEAA